MNILQKLAQNLQAQLIHLIRSRLIIIWNRHVSYLYSLNTQHLIVLKIIGDLKPKSSASYDNLSSKLLEYIKVSFLVRLAYLLTSLCVLVYFQANLNWLR